MLYILMKQTLSDEGNDLFLQIADTFKQDMFGS